MDAVMPTAQMVLGDPKFVQVPAKKPHISWAECVECSGQSLSMGSLGPTAFLQITENADRIEITCQESVHGQGTGHWSLLSIEMNSALGLSVLAFLPAYLCCPRT